MEPGPSAPPAGRPNLVVIVLDCVRASSFPGTGAPPGERAYFEQLAAESTLFTRASTVAPWTLPSHASLFTGTYPWEHGVMGDGHMEFDESIPNVAGILRDLGYRSLALSANGIISPLLATAHGFDQYRCAEWWEKTFRWIEPEQLEGTPEARPRGGGAAASIVWDRLRSGSALRTPRRDLLRDGNRPVSIDRAVHDARPEEAELGPTADWALWAGIDGANRIARTLRTPNDPRALPIAPWIEPTLETWLADEDPKRPVFVFVNLLDAHEKYLSDGKVVSGFPSWFRFTRVSQNARRWLAGDWQPSAAELSLLHNLYNESVARLEQRVARIVEILRRAGRWDNSLLVVTSDHGQAFGEHNELFHERSPFETLLHVPLLVRWPSGQTLPGVRTGHVGVIDLAPTLLRAAGGSIPPGMSGVPLQESELRPLSTPVLAMADGFPSIERHRTGPESLLDRLRHVYSVAYAGPYKAIAEMEDAPVRLFDVTQDPDERRDLGEVSDPAAETAIRGAKVVADRIRQVSRGSLDPDVRDRLVSWGYI